tara:strand:- start:1324 stop:1716 length:393 start_codon:yes stop_codon:yes gene_type:complete
MTGFDEFQNVGDTKYFKYKECEPGQMLVTGEFIKEFEGLYGTQYEYLDDDGSPVVLNAAAKLNAKMKFANPGDRVRIEYDGETEVMTGPMKGKPMHLFKVAIAKKKAAPVEAPVEVEETVQLGDFSDDML